MNCLSKASSVAEFVGRSNSVVGRTGFGSFQALVVLMVQCSSPLLNTRWYRICLLSIETGYRLVLMWLR